MMASSSTTMKKSKVTTMPLIRDDTCNEPKYKFQLEIATQIDKVGICSATYGFTCEWY